MKTQKLTYQDKAILYRIYTNTAMVFAVLLSVFLLYPLWVKATNLVFGINYILIKYIVPIFYFLSIISTFIGVNMKLRWRRENDTEI